MKIVVLFQSVLGIYGDHGNAIVLQKRAAWRGIKTELVFVEPGDKIPADGNVYLLGGGEDKAQISATRTLLEDRGLFKAIENGAALLAVCAGYQMCGNTFTVGDDPTVIEGLGVLDVDTRRAEKRAVGECLSSWIRPDGSEYLITGFENHGGATTLGPKAKPLAKVLVGAGNGDGTDGAQQGNVIGLYPHGPVLPRNPGLADHVLELALGKELEPLKLPEIDLLRSQRIKAVRH